jgi:hypothetical protein
MLEGLSVLNVRRMFKPGTHLSLMGERIIIIIDASAHRIEQFHYVVSKHPVALSMPLLGFSLHLLFAAPSIYLIPPSRLFCLLLFI